MVYVFMYMNILQIYPSVYSESSFHFCHDYDSNPSIFSHPDYCNILLTGLLPFSLSLLKLILHTATRIFSLHVDQAKFLFSQPPSVFSSHRFKPETPILSQKAYMIWPLNTFLTPSVSLPLYMLQLHWPPCCF